MEKELSFFYDKEGDVLDMTIGEPVEAMSEEIQEDFFVRRDPKTDEIVGFMVLNFEKRFQKLGTRETIPLTAVFNSVK